MGQSCDWMNVKPAGAGRGLGTRGAVCCRTEQWDQLSILTHKIAVLPPPLSRDTNKQVTRGESKQEGFQKGWLVTV